MTGAVTEADMGRSATVAVQQHEPVAHGDREETGGTVGHEALG